MPPIISRQGVTWNFQVAKKRSTSAKIRSAGYRQPRQCGQVGTKKMPPLDTLYNIPAATRSLFSLQSWEYPGLHDDWREVGKLRTGN